MNQPHSRPLAVLTSLFFMWGLITSLNDILVPHFKAMFSLTFVQAILVQSCFFSAYFVVSMPAGWLLQRLGYQRGIIIGLCTVGVGCLMFYPAASLRAYPFFLGALFVLASGITLLQVAANPYVTFLGAPETASSRLNLAQAFNSLGATLGPLVGAVTILGVADHTAAAVNDPSSVQGPYLVLAALLFVLAAAVALFRLPDVRKMGSDTVSKASSQQPVRSIWSQRHLVLGAVGIFTYVGAEVSIGSFFVSLMSDPANAGFSHATAGRYLAFIGGAAMVGRFVGSALMRSVPASRVLACAGMINAMLIGLAICIGGPVAMWALLLTGLFNSIMFPTIFSLALESLGERTSLGSGVLCMAIVGGAVVPLLQAMLADHMTLLVTFVVPLVCYLFIAYYGTHGYRPLAVATKPDNKGALPQSA
ncbi:sugar MFS transporter [Chitinimonas sp. BJB300]|uniref:sugar MFS transporter n=1 Tax=Chitinimonas sp. BJB300 TaxID=1559339 RepID=UPI000C0E83D6|nr:sugar MFS transporter [Chitinimonas sp. BJB300]PHV11676.1 glucose/galactose MFS transporter [Chitinimonas sp. BJB300]TSJ85930.1 sugar MFS transporter [Chitinimonas sp. BJB300]